MSVIGKRIVFIGAPGVGKGTFAKILCSRWNLPHVCVGDSLREDLAGLSSGAKGHNKVLQGSTDRIVQYMKNGVLIPDSIICDYVGLKLSSLGGGSYRAGYILDGFPRNKSQVGYLLENDLVDTVVHITLERWVSIQKIMGRRRCTTCGNDFNVADVMTGGFHMPAILPTDEEYACPQKVIGNECRPNFSIRSDDNIDSLSKRLESYDAETTVAVESFRAAARESGKIKVHHFPVKRGILDTDDLAQVILS
jgi:adenylate kinase